MDGSPTRAAEDPGPRAAVEHLLHTARRHLGMEAAFLAELTETEQIHRATTGADADTFTIFDGGRLPRLEGYCRHVMETDAPWVIRDTSAEPEVQHLAVTAAGRFGAYIGVPVKRPDGSSFGTLCCLSHRPRPDLGSDEVATLQALADILGFHVDQLGGLQQQASELADHLESYELQLEVFRHLVDASPNPKLLLDPSSLRVVYANRAAAELAGRDRETMLGGAPWDHHECWDRDDLLHHLGPLRDGVADAVHHTFAPTATTPPMDVQAQLVAGGSGSSYILWTGHDVTQHHELEERLQGALALEREAGDRLRRLDTLRNAFLTAVSHELRTPLTTVRGAAETLQDGRVPEQAIPRMLERLRVNADRLDRLLTDLLDLNQFAHGALILRREVVRLDDLIRGAVAEVDLDDRELALDLDEVVAAVAPVKMERLVVNLVRNAAVHTPPGTPVEIVLREEDQEILLVVSDHGKGVPEGDRTELFEPFAQGATAPPHQPGTGIGLSLVAAFAELHGGRVWIDDAPGGGAAFHVRLPTDGAAFGGGLRN